MLQFEELKLALEDLQPDLKDLKDALGMEAMEREIAELEQKQAEPGFWDRMEESQKILQRASFLKNRVEDYQKLVSTYGDALALIEMGDEAEDLSLLPEAQEEVEKIKQDVYKRQVMYRWKF